MRRKWLWYTSRMPAYRPESERFWEKVIKTDSCWLWTAGCNGRNKEYGCFYLAGGKKSIGAHVWSYTQSKGPVPDGLVVDHLCNNTKCVNPLHLEAKTHQTNILRGRGLAAHEAQQTRCKRGHSLKDAHILSGNRRDCRQCRIIRNNERTYEYRKEHG